MNVTSRYSWGKAAWSVGLFGLYVMIEGMSLMFMPGPILAIAGLPAPADVWIHVAGMMIFFVGTFEIMSAVEGWTLFFRASVPLRFLVPIFFGIFVLAGWAGPALMPLAAADALGALWTWWALRQDAAAGKL